MVRDAKNGPVSVAGARDDHGVVITDAKTLTVDMIARINCALPLPPRPLDETAPLQLGVRLVERRRQPVE